MKDQKEVEEYLASIRQTIAKSENLLAEADLRIAETDRFLESQGLTREQVLSLKLSGEQRRLVDEELRRRGLPGLEDDEARGVPPVYETTPSWGASDTQGDLDNRRADLYVASELVEP